MVLPAGLPWDQTTHIPMCNFDFTDAKAAQICQILGYKRGRKFFSPAVTFPSGTPPARVAFGLNCAAATATGRRLRAGGDAAAKRRDLLALDQWGEYEVDGQPISNMPYDAVIATTTASAPSNCSITVRQRCDSPFYYAGVECSDKQFKAAPPPMAVPPSPPPPPAAKDAFIKAISPESNLCATCSPYDPVNRFELDVTYNPTAVIKRWAPVCGFNISTYSDFAQALAVHLCKMAVDCPACKLRGQDIYPFAATPYVVPAGPYAAGAFNPTTKTHWAVITPRAITPTQPYNLARLIQDSAAPVFQVTTTPCKTLFAARCNVVQYD